MFADRLNSCLLLATGECPCQMQMARVYLIPQLMTTLQLTLLEQTCMNCNLFRQIQRSLYLPPLSTQVSRTRGPSCF